MPKQTTCAVSGQSFVHTDQDLAFYKKIGVPLPKLCPHERRRRRFAFRNERALYERKSSLSGEKFISCHHPDNPWPVCTPKEWWGDDWDATIFGRDYDFDRPFLDQYMELQKVVPQIGINDVNNQNCPYANYAADCKNCHLIFGSIYCEDCLYGNPYYCKCCIDSLLVRDSEWCYDCITCEKCYECFYCQDCVGSNNLIFCYDCRTCSDCIGCVGLRGKKFHIFNKKYSEADYKKFRAQLDLCNSAQVAHVREQFNELKLKTPRRSMTAIQCEEVTGDYIYNSKNTHDSYDCQRCWDCAYVAQVIDLKDAHDCNYTEELEIAYDYIGMYRAQRVFFSVWMHNCSDIWYSSYCVSSKNLFGCIGLRNQEYCILNKTYQKEEFEELRTRIIEQMKKEGTFGEFFPVSHSLFPYNETVADEYFPMSKDEALKRGYAWRDKDPKEYQPQTVAIMDDISKVPDSIVDEVLACEWCEKNFRLTETELKFYKKFVLPVPKKCADCRHRDRLALRNPRTLFERPCTKCGANLQSTYKADRPEMVTCEKCYESAVY